jgi:uncharacterized protein (TIGR00369 family)
MTADEALAAIPYARFLGVRLEGDAEGRVCVLPFREDLIGSVVRRALHGGVVGAFLELTALAEVLALGESPRVPKPINFSVNYLRPARARDTRARAELVKQGRRIVNVRVLAWQDDAARPVAAGIGNFLLPPPSS